MLLNFSYNFGWLICSSRSMIDDGVGSTCCSASWGPNFLNAPNKFQYVAEAQATHSQSASRPRPAQCQGTNKPCWVIRSQHASVRVEGITYTLGSLSSKLHYTKGTSGIFKTVLLSPSFLLSPRLLFTSHFHVLHRHQKWKTQPSQSTPSMRQPGKEGVSTSYDP